MAGRTRYRGRRPGVEGLESRRLLALTYQFDPMAVAVTPSSIVTGPDGLEYFTISPDSTAGAVGGVGSVNTTTGAMTFTTTPTQTDTLGPIISALGGLYFAENDPGTHSSAIGVLNPATGTIAEFPIPIANAQIGGLTLGSDGNIYFTDPANNAIGKFVVNDYSHPVTEVQLPKTGEQPDAIATAPSGLIFYGFTDGIGSYNSTTGAFSQLTLTSPTNDGTTTSAVSFAMGGDGRLYFAEQYYEELGGLGPPPTGFALASIEPTAPLTMANVTSDTSILARSVAPAPGGDIAYQVAGGLGVGLYDTTTQTASSTQLAPSQLNYYMNGINGTPLVGQVAVSAGGAIAFPVYGAIGVATTIPANQATIVGAVAADPLKSYADTIGIPSGVGRHGQLVYLDLKHDGKLDPGDPTAVTDASGTFTFNGLAAGTYTVGINLYPGESIAYPSGGTLSVTATAGQSTTSQANIGLVTGSAVAPQTADYAPFGTNPPDVQTAEATAYYNLILGRAPDAPGLAAAVSYLKGGGSLQALAQSFLTSTEYETKLVQSYYTDFLGRTGSASEVASWVAAMQEGLSAEQVATYFLTSAEFDADHASNASFVTALYEDLLGRQPLATDLAVWLPAMSGGLTRAQVVDGILYSNESLGNALSTTDALFDGEVTIYDYTTELQAVQSGTSTLAQAVAAVASQQAFVNRANQAVAG